MGQESLHNRKPFSKKLGASNNVSAELLNYANFKVFRGPLVKYIEDVENKSLKTEWIIIFHYLNTWKWPLGILNVKSSNLFIFFSM